MWLHAANGLLVATVMPTAVAEIGGLAFIAWTEILYELGTIVASASLGLVAVRHGVRGGLRGAALLYSAGCVLAALAPDIATVLAGRLLQGLGGGAMVAMVFVAMTRHFPGALWPRLVAVVSGVWGSSALAGPLIGGAFTELGHWRGGFVAFAAQGLLMIVVAGVFRDEPPGERAAAAEALPLARLAALAVGVLAVATAGVARSPGASASLVVAGITVLALVLRADARAANRLLPAGILDPRGAVGIGAVGVFCLSAGAVGLAAYGPLLLQVLHGIGPLAAGVLLALASVAWTAAAIAFSGVGARGEVACIRAGSVLVSVGLAGLAVTIVTGPVYAIALFAMAQGAGFGMSWGFVSRRMISAADARDRDKASSSLPTVQRLGFATGAAACGIVANGLGLADGADPAPAAFWTFAAFVPITALGTWATWRLVAAR